MYSYAFHTYISKRIIFVTEIIPKATWPCMSCVKITFMIKALHKYVDSSLDYFLIYYFQRFYCTRKNVHRDVSVIAPEF